MRVGTHLSTNGWAGSAVRTATWLGLSLIACIAQPAVAADRAANVDDARIAAADREVDGDKQGKIEDGQRRNAERQESLQQQSSQRHADSNRKIEPVDLDLLARYVGGGHQRGGSLIEESGFGGSTGTLAAAGFGAAITELSLASEVGGGSVFGGAAAG